MVQCEDCKFANWDATLFRDSEEGHWEGSHYIPPYSEQFDVYCIKHERFFMEQEITGDCQDGEYGPNNYHDVCKEHYRQIDEINQAIKGATLSWATEKDEKEGTETPAGGDDNGGDDNGGENGGGGNGDTPGGELEG